MHMGGHKVPMHLPTLRRHALNRLAQTGQLKGLLDGISTNQAFVKSDMLPGGGEGMPKQEACAREVAARTGKQSFCP
jgi:hypothetical protein